jgi:hypothetical protein
VDIYEGRQWVGGKVASFQDKDGNHIEVRQQQHQQQQQQQQCKQAHDGSIGW